MYRSASSQGQLLKARGSNHGGYRNFMRGYSSGLWFFIRTGGTSGIVRKMGYHLCGAVVEKY